MIVYYSKKYLKINQALKEITDTVGLQKGEKYFKVLILFYKNL